MCDLTESVLCGNGNYVTVFHKCASYYHYILNHIAPGPPQDLTLVNRTCHSITFQWSPPDDTGRLDVTGYDILHNGTPVANITGAVYTLEGLTPNTVHTISVRTRNVSGPAMTTRCAL